jgi:hypothetical protein
VTHQAHREVEPPAHAAGVRLHAPVERLDQVEPFDQLDRPCPGRPAAEVHELADHHEVLAPGLLVVDRDGLPGQADRAAHLEWFADDVVPRHARGPAVGVKQRGQDADRGGLARAVRSEQPVHRSLGDPDVDAVQDQVLPVCLAEACCLDDHVPSLVVLRMRYAN